MKFLVEYSPVVWVCGWVVDGIKIRLLWVCGFASRILHRLHAAAAVGCVGRLQMAAGRSNSGADGFFMLREFINLLICIILLQIEQSSADWMEPRLIGTQH